MSEKVDRECVYKRAGGICEGCRVPLPNVRLANGRYMWDWHHIEYGRGRRKKKGDNEAWNGAALCNEFTPNTNMCHHSIHSRGNEKLRYRLVGEALLRKPEDQRSKEVSDKYKASKKLHKQRYQEQKEFWEPIINENKPSCSCGCGRPSKKGRLLKSCLHKQLKNA